MNVLKSAHVPSDYLSNSRLFGDVFYCTDLAYRGRKAASANFQHQAQSALLKAVALLSQHRVRFVAVISSGVCETALCGGLDLMSVTQRGHLLSPGVHLVVHPYISSIVGRQTDNLVVMPSLRNNGGSENEKCSQERISCKKDTIVRGFCQITFDVRLSVCAQPTPHD